MKDALDEIAQHLGDIKSALVLPDGALSVADLALLRRWGPTLEKLLGAILGEDEAGMADDHALALMASELRPLLERLRR